MAQAQRVVVSVLLSHGGAGEKMETAVLLTTKGSGSGGLVSIPIIPYKPHNNPSILISVINLVTMPRLTSKCGPRA